MTSGQTCPDCGSSNLVDDSLYSQSQLVCVDCGSVVSEGFLTTTRSEEIQGTDVRYRESTAVDKQPCRNQIQGETPVDNLKRKDYFHIIPCLKRVRALCRILRFPRVMEETAESLFSQAYEHPSFLHVSLQKKEVLAGGCVLLSSRQHNWPITMGTIYSLLEASEHTMGAVYNELVKILNVEAPPNSIVDLLESHCHQYKLGPSEVPEVFSESTARLVERAAALVELASDTWLVTGRHPVNVMVGAVYLAWLSLNPCQARLGVPLGRFCRIAKVGRPAKAAVRVAELKEVLCQLGRELPWLRGAPVEPRTVPTLTGDILKYRVLLMKKAMRSFESELPPVEPNTCPDPATERPLAEPNTCPDPATERPLAEPNTCPDPATERPPVEPNACPDPATEKPPVEPNACPDPATERPPVEPNTCPDPTTERPPVEPNACPDPATERPPVEPNTCPDPATERPPVKPNACPDPDTERPPVEPNTCPDPATEPAKPRHAQVEGKEATVWSEEFPSPATQMQASDWPSGEARSSSSVYCQSQAHPPGDVNPNEEAATFDLDSRDMGGDPVPESNWAKRHLFVPPCTRKPPKKRRVEEVGPAVTGYEEISDSEIEGYLRTPQEMDEFVELQRSLMSAD